MQDFMKSFEHNGRTYRVVWDEDHETRGSYSYDTEEETKAAEDEEIRNLESGKWVVVGCIVTRPCPGPHCNACAGTVEEDSLWGIVCDSGEAQVKQTIIDLMG